jgi:diguanylate cyclase (GGDEF)-like protein
MKILIAARTTDDAEALGKILHEEGYECQFVGNGPEIIDKVYQEPPDAIILDTKCNQQGCLELLKKLKSAPSTWDIPVILSSPQRVPATLSKGYRLGAYDFIFRPYLREEILARVCNVTSAFERVKALEGQLNRDDLTTLYNRRFFMERFQEEVTWSMRYKEPLSLILLDIDHFKKVNDNYGHSCGDEVLKQVALTAQSVAGPGPVAARYGGEEFIILLPNTSQEESREVAEKLRALVQSKDFCCTCDNAIVHLALTVSIGVTTYDPRAMLTPDRVINLADDALYAAKEGGRNRVVVQCCAEPAGTT